LQSTTLVRAAAWAALLVAMACFSMPNDFANKVRLDRYGMAAGVRTGTNAKHKNCSPELVEAVDLPSGSRNVLEDRLGLSAVWISHSAQIRNAEHAHDVAFAHCSTIDIPNARWLRAGHGN
jgi:hypothetical protein